MIIFGWIVATLGAISLAVSVLLEIKKKEKIYMLLAKISSGILGIGGIILAIFYLR